MKLTDEQRKAIDELADLLRAKQIPFTIQRDTNGIAYNQLLIWTSPFSYLSAICQYGSYGFQNNLIEVYNFIDQPTGYLSPSEAAELLAKWWKERQK